MGSGDTRERLILAAEHLFAHRGIQGVSLREINVAAGQRNTSASHYHFGSKDALLAAVLDFRDEDLRSQRLARLEALDRDPPQDLARGVVEAFVMPAADLMDTAPDFLLFVAQLFLQPPTDWRELVGHEDSALKRAGRMLTSELSVPARLVTHRLVLMTQHLTTSLAAHIRVSKDGGDDSLALPRAAFLNNLIDTMTANLAVAPSARTLAALGDAHEGP